MAEDKTIETGAQEEIEATDDKTYTQAEVDELLQREVDRRITSALKKQEVKNQKKLKEAEKLAAMSEQDKLKYELEQRELAIEEKERALALAENKTEASKILNERGIDLALVDFIVAEDADTMMANIDLLDKAFKKSVKAEVEKRLSGSAPKKGLPREAAITKEQFNKMSYSELIELKTNNPELYTELSK